MIVPKVSVIMAVFNPQKRWLNLAISSILKQSFPTFEFIIINDFPNNSNLAKTLSFYKRKDKRIIIIKNEKNIGLTKSLNRGLKIARGKYIARMDADDISFPQRIEKQLAYLEKNPNIFLIGSQVNIIDDQENLIRKKKLPTTPEMIKKILPHRNCLVHPSIMFRNEKFFYREKFFYAQDYDFYLRAISEGKNIANYPEVLLSYRFSNHSISFARFRQQVYFAYFAKKFYRQRLILGKDNYRQFDGRKITNGKTFAVGAELMLLKKKIGRILGL